MTEFEKELKDIGEFGIKDSPIRKAYEEKVAGLKEEARRMAEEGLPEEEIARKLHNMRRTLGEEYKLAAPPLLREYIYYATARVYGDPLGPTYEDLRARKTPAEIIESASRPIKDLNDRLTEAGFMEWYEETKGGEESPK